MSTALYRITTNEVVKISLSNQTFSDRDTNYWGVLTDPILLDGNQAVDVNGNLRILGTAKFAVVGLNTVRNAIQSEIDAFATGQTTDENAQDAAEAIQFFDTHPRFRKAFKAMVKRIIAENNTQAAQWNTFRAQVALASNLSNLQSRVANNTTDMPIRTLSQALAALASDVSTND